MGKLHDRMNGDWLRWCRSRLAGRFFKPGNLAYINQKGQIVIKSMSAIPDRPDWGERDLSYHGVCGGAARVGLGKNQGAPLYDAEGYINKEG